MKWEGGCLCGALRYRATGEPLYHGCCHCRRCQKFSGSAFWTYISFKPDVFEWTRGQPKLYDSSSQVDRGFCDRCGSSISFHRHDAIDVAMTSLDEPDKAPPQEHIFIEEKRPWLHLSDNLPQHESFGPDYEHLIDPDIQ